MEFSKQIIEILDKLAEQLGLAIDWTSKNIAPYVEKLIQKYTTYNIVNCVVGASFGLLFLIIPSIIIYRIYKSREKWVSKGYEYTPSEIVHYIGIAICIMLLITGTIMFPVFLTSLIKWICIPELQIVEEAKNLLTNN